jgi:hypothetical protein
LAGRSSMLLAGYRDQTSLQTFLEPTGPPIMPIIFIIPRISILHDFIMSRQSGIISAIIFSGFLLNIPQKGGHNGFHESNLLFVGKTIEFIPQFFHYRRPPFMFTKGTVYTGRSGPLIVSRPSP